MSASSTMIGRIRESMKGATAGGTARLMALGLPITTMILLFSIAATLGRPMPKNGTAVILTLFAADLVAALLVATVSNEDNSLTDGDRLVLMAAATISVALGLVTASYFWVM
ncbi:hypothetical protein BLA23254_04625 [Burkholderia lata]|uniref:Uncharacterized protein n=1 Tax=Burkholderia lata (strain ATCC 17760 / DSM 23089 / LMG 22485 / NCIMB 9086 / R18194 / 383) TaxID=482957 RepID=A0A6P2NQX5_BURL3|nr:hypothetical protein [Burkholderia lata]VWB97302.1 hypothetical protein BLA23254_04625 [Burkholderia lata]